MFCIECGRKLNAGASRCPKCGGDAAPADYCGGFWKLTEATPAAPPAGTADEAVMRQQQEQLADAQRKLTVANSRMRAMRTTLVVLGVALLVMLAALLISVLGRSKPAPEPAPEPTVTTQTPPVVTKDPGEGSESTNSSEESSDPSAEPTVSPDPTPTPEPTPTPTSTPTPTPATSPQPSHNPKK